MTEDFRAPRLNPDVNAYVEELMATPISVLRGQDEASTMPEEERAFAKALIELHEQARDGHGLRVKLTGSVSQLQAYAYRLFEGLILGDEYLDNGEKGEAAAIHNLTLVLKAYRAGLRAGHRA